MSTRANNSGTWTLSVSMAGPQVHDRGRSQLVEEILRSDDVVEALVNEGLVDQHWLMVRTWCGVVWCVPPPPM